jgi:hypothetical protein
VTSIKSLKIASVRLAAGLAISMWGVAPLPAADWSYKIVEPPATYDGDFSMRFWFGEGKTCVSASMARSSSATA